MRHLIYALALALPGAAHAQLAVVPKPVDTSTLATKSEVTAIAAQIPQPATTIPSPDMTTTGVADPSLVFRPIGAQAPRITRSVKQAVTGSNGTATITWAAMPTVPALDITEYVTSADQAVPQCYGVIGTVTTTGATIKCYIDQSIGGLGLFPRKVAGAGIVFDVIAVP